MPSSQNSIMPMPAICMRIYGPKWGLHPEVEKVQSLIFGINIAPLNRKKRNLPARSGSAGIASSKVAPHSVTAAAREASSARSTDVSTVTDASM